MYLPGLVLVINSVVWYVPFDVIGFLEIRWNLAGISLGNDARHETFAVVKQVLAMLELSVLSVLQAMTIFDRAGLIIPLQMCTGSSGREVLVDGVSGGQFRLAVFV